MRVEKERLLGALEAEDAALEGALEACERQLDALRSSLLVPELHGEAYGAIRGHARRWHPPLPSRGWPRTSGTRPGG